MTSKIIMIVEQNQLNYCPVCGDTEMYIKYHRRNERGLRCQNCETEFPIMRIK